MFYNFQLSLVLAKYCGWDLGSYLGDKKDFQGTTLWMLWVRLMMGLMLSPYAAIQGLLWASDVVKGDRSDPNNPFRWYNISLNLPGEPSYSPKSPWMSKVRGSTQELAVDFTTYVDDSKVVAGSAKEAWRASRRVGSIWKKLVLQDAPWNNRMDG